MGKANTTEYIRSIIVPFCRFIELPENKMQKRQPTLNAGDISK